MPRFPLIAFGALLCVSPAFAVAPFPVAFHAQQIATNGTSLHVRVGGHGPAVVLLHGFGDSGDMWAPVAAKLVKDHTVVVPICAAWGCRRIPTPATPRRTRRSISRA
jgi:hypothetical protein